MGCERIAELLGLSLDQVRHEKRYYKEEQSLVSKKVVENGLRGSFTNIKKNIIEVIGTSLNQYKDAIESGHTMSTSDLKNIMSIYNDIDKIERLQAGSPTDIQDLHIVSFDEMKDKLKTMDFDDTANVDDIEVDGYEVLE